jgi:hypothetical protein
MFAKKIILAAAIFGALAVVPGVASAREDHKGHYSGHDQHSYGGRGHDDHRSYSRGHEEHYRREPARDIRPYPPPPVCTPAPVACTPPPCATPVVVCPPLPPPFYTPPPPPVVITPSYRHVEVLYRANTMEDWKISSEYASRPEAENAATKLESQGYETMLRIPS